MTEFKLAFYLERAWQFGCEVYPLPKLGLFHSILRICIYY